MVPDLWIAIHISELFSDSNDDETKMELMQWTVQASIIGNFKYNHVNMQRKYSIVQTNMSAHQHTRCKM